MNTEIKKIHVKEITKFSKSRTDFNLRVILLSLLLILYTYSSFGKNKEGLYINKFYKNPSELLLKDTLLNTTKFKSNSDALYSIKKYAYFNMYVLCTVVDTVTNTLTINYLSKYLDIDMEYSMVIHIDANKNISIKIYDKGSYIYKKFYFKECFINGYLDSNDIIYDYIIHEGLLPFKNNIDNITKNISYYITS